MPASSFVCWWIIVVIWTAWAKFIFSIYFYVTNSIFILFGNGNILYSSTINCSLHQKWKREMQVLLIFWVERLMPSKHLTFLSFQIVHHMQARIIFHHSLWPIFPLIPLQVHIRPNLETNGHWFQLPVGIESMWDCTESLFSEGFPVWASFSYY